MPKRPPPRAVLASGWRWHFHWEPADWWVGCYWQRKTQEGEVRLGNVASLEYGMEHLNLYIAVVPCIQLHLQRRRVLAPLGAKSWDSPTTPTPQAVIRDLQSGHKIPRTYEEMSALQNDAHPATYPRRHRNGYY